MSNYFQWRARIRPAIHTTATFVVGQRVRIVSAPLSYGYNGRVGIVAEVNGAQINLLVDEHPTDLRCTTFYAEELEPEVALSTESSC